MPAAEAPPRPLRPQSPRRPATPNFAPLSVPPAIAIPPLAIVTAVLSWWAWKSGGYFPAGFLPGLIVLLGLLVALVLGAPWRARLQGPGLLALVSLGALGAWTLLSAVWSPAPDVAIDDGVRVLGYALLVLLGIATCLLLGRRMVLCLTPIAAAGALVGVATLIAVWTRHDAATLLAEDGTLRYPLGYRNAEAAFFLLSAWASLQLILSAGLDWRVRGLLLGSTSLGIELAILSQSRGSVFAATAGAIVFVALQPSPPKALGWVALAAVAPALALPWLLDVYGNGGGNAAASLGPLHTACLAAAITSVGAAGAGMLAALAEPRIYVGAASRRAIRTAITAIGGIAIVALVVVLATSSGGPTGFVNRHLDQLTAGTPPDDQATRFGLDLRTDRGDFWRVGIRGLRDQPLKGDGAGGFRFSYLKDRRSDLQPEDPHSVEVLAGSELGFPGLILFSTFVVAGVIGVFRSRRLGPSAVALSAGALGLGTYWLVHASVEWFWSYPSITAPAMFALGAALAPAQLDLSRSRPARSTRVAALSVCAALAAVSLPIYLSDRYTTDAWHDWRDRHEIDYDRFQRAADLDPLAIRPLVYEAAVAEEAGDPEHALAALSRAEGRRPDDWTIYYLEARVLASTDPSAAIAALGRARSLNPRGAEITSLQEQIAG
jgi:hypothetical protein